MLGGDVRVGSAYYRVVGVMAPRTKSATDEIARRTAQPTESSIFIPLETAKTRYGELLRKIRSGSFEQERVELHEVTVKVASPEQVAKTADAITALLERHHKKKDYELVVPLELLRREQLALEALIRRPGRAVLRSTLEESVYAMDDEIGSNALDSHLSRLRRKLDEVDAGVEIRAIRNLGYLLRAVT